MQPETKFKINIRPHLDAIPRSWFLKTQMLSTLGIPDFIGCVDGRFVALELKKDAKEARKTSGRMKLQKYVLRKIEDAGGYARVVSPENWPAVHAELLKLAPILIVHACD